MNASRRSCNSEQQYVELLAMLFVFSTIDANNLRQTSTFDIFVNPPVIFDLGGI